MSKIVDMEKALIAKINKLDINNIKDKEKIIQIQILLKQIKSKGKYVKWNNF